MVGIRQTVTWGVGLQGDQNPSALPAGVEMGAAALALPPEAKHTLAA